MAVGAQSRFQPMGALPPSARPARLPWGVPSGQGRCALSGYTLTLHFDNGSVKRLFFCFLNQRKTGLRMGEHSDSQAR